MSAPLPGLDVDQVPAEPAGPSGRPRPGVRWKRKAPADDCAACFADQHAAAVMGRPVPVRMRAVWVRLEDADAGTRGYRTGPGRVARTSLCAAHRADREAADRASGGAS